VKTLKEQLSLKEKKLRQLQDSLDALKEEFVKVCLSASLTPTPLAHTLSLARAFAVARTLRSLSSSLTYGRTLSTLPLTRMCGPSLCRHVPTAHLWRTYGVADGGGSGAVQERCDAADAVATVQVRCR
jgi:hypothetical protein